MKVLLDTHAFLWWLGDDPKLSAAAREAVRSPDALVHVSAASIWEIAIKVTLGRLDVQDSDWQRRSRQMASSNWRSPRATRSARAHCRDITMIR